MRSLARFIDRLANAAFAFACLMLALLVMKEAEIEADLATISALGTAACIVAAFGFWIAERLTAWCARRSPDN